jgi:ankyrin repeat protein
MSKMCVTISLNCKGHHRTSNLTEQADRSRCVLICYRKNLAMGLQKLDRLEDELEALFSNDEHGMNSTRPYEAFQVRLQAHYEDIDALISRKTQQMRGTIKYAKFSDLTHILHLSSTDRLACFICRQEHLCLHRDQYTVLARLQSVTGSFRTCRKHHTSFDRNISYQLEIFFDFYDGAISLCGETLKKLEPSIDLPDIANRVLGFIPDEIIFQATKFGTHDHSLKNFTGRTRLDLLGRTWLHQMLDVPPRTSAKALWANLLSNIRMDIHVADGIPQWIGSTDVTGRAVLHIACQKGYTAIAAELLAHKANPMQRAAGGLLPLHFAAASGSLEICKHLIQHILHTDISAVDAVGKRSIDYARINKHFEVVHLLSSASSDSSDFFASSALGPILKGRSHGYHPRLIGAIQEQNIQEVERLLLNGADPNVVFDSSGPSSALVEALQFKYLNSWCPIVESLLCYGAHVDTRLSDGSTALHFFTQREHIETIEYLVHMGASLNVQNNAGRTALMYACERGLPGVVELLLEKMEDVKLLEMMDYDGLSTMDYALKRGDKRQVRMLHEAIAKGRSNRLGSLNSSM